jgi:hypothetical protein
VHCDFDRRLGDACILACVRIPTGVAPSREQLAGWAKREAELKARGGTVFSPERESAVPSTEEIDNHVLRTIPPR